MANKYTTNGNLALKEFKSDATPALKLIDCKASHEPTHRQILDQIFAERCFSSVEGEVAAILNNMPGIPLFTTKMDKLFAAVASGIACFALFFLSFFPF